MNADAIPAENRNDSRAAADDAGASTSKKSLSGRRDFEQIMRSQASRAGCRTGSLCDSMDDDTLLGDGTAIGTVSDFPEVGDAFSLPATDPLPPAALFGASLAGQVSRRTFGGGAAGAVAAGGAAPGRRLGLSRGGAFGSVAPPLRGEEAAWELAIQLVERLSVAEARLAQHGAVHMVLKGELFQGTAVRIQREGHSVSIHFSAASMGSYRTIRESVDALKQSLSDSLPNCQVTVCLVEPHDLHREG